MHTTGTHRAHVIAGPAPEETLPGHDTPELRRQAALFNAHRAAVQEAEARAEAQAQTLAEQFAEQQQADQQQQGDGQSQSQSQPQTQSQPQAQQPQPKAPFAYPSPRGPMRGSNGSGNGDANGAGNGVFQGNATALLQTAVDADTSRQAPLPQEAGERNGHRPHDPQNGEAPRAAAPAPAPPPNAPARDALPAAPIAFNPPGSQNGPASTDTQQQQQQAPRPVAGFVPYTGGGASNGRGGGPSQGAQNAAPVFAFVPPPSADANADAPEAEQAARQPPPQPAPPAAAHTAQQQRQASTAPARVDALSAAQAIGALDNGLQPQALIDSIVASVDGFCANPAVNSVSPWHITVPLDPKHLPGCELSLMLSHFDLTLRFSTTDGASQQLILRHADALKERLDNLPSLHRDNRRRIDITVT